MKFTSFEEYKEIYLSGNYEDPHAELAKRKGFSRNEAKESVFHFLYGNPSGKLCPDVLDENTVKLYCDKYREGGLGLNLLEVNLGDLEEKAKRL